ncbi:unnamed protein product, partial [Mesorhabditis belari]|uniref:NADP-dependent oxidoreductase domain-containing protein n=1 Tax=Mesorhabditis belari TaxID=2138241 RepID=A0AAF3FVE5_9BILA
MSSPFIKLSSGFKMPQFGLGTWLAKPGEVANAVEIALKVGYQHIDCAVSYENQHEIGPVFQKAFKDGVIKRENLFVCSKVWNTRHSFDKAKLCVSEILRDLQLDYLDLCLIHWPVGYDEETNEIWPKHSDGRMRYSNVHYSETWKALEDCVEKGLVKSIGLSNFNHKQIEEILGMAKIKPAVLQVEMHPYFQQKKMRDFCGKHGIAITAYSPLANPTMPFRKDGDPTILTDSIFLRIAEKHGKSPAQVALRWAIQEGIIVIPKSISEKRIKENFSIFDYELDEKDMDEIRGVDRNWRILNTVERDGKHPFWGFGEEY